MSNWKKHLATLLACVAFAGSASAGTVSAGMAVSGTVLGVASISTGPLALGNHTKIEFNDGRTYTHTFTVNVTEGMAYSLCPDTPNVAWPLGGGTAINVSASSEVWLMVYRDDGVTPITPTSCWNRTGTGVDEAVNVVWKPSVPVNATGLGAISKTLQPSITY